MLSEKGGFQPESDKVMLYLCTSRYRLFRKVPNGKEDTGTLVFSVLELSIRCPYRKTNGTRELLESTPICVDFIFTYVSQTVAEQGNKHVRK